jgi:hypothetical protein
MEMSGRVLATLIDDGVVGEPWGEVAASSPVEATSLLGWHNPLQRF